MDSCGAVRVCGRPVGHRGQHGGFRRRPEPETRLTPRQLDVVRRIALGHTWDRICSDIAISHNTLGDHRMAAMARYGVSTVFELFTALGWLDVPLPASVSVPITIRGSSSVPDLDSSSVTVEDVKATDTLAPPIAILRRR